MSNLTAVNAAEREEMLAVLPWCWTLARHVTHDDGAAKECVLAAVRSLVGSRAARRDGDRMLATCRDTLADWRRRHRAQLRTDLPWPDRGSRAPEAGLTVRAALLSLSLATRDVLALTAYGLGEPDEIAALIGCPPEQVEHDLDSACRDLAARLGLEGVQLGATVARLMWALEPVSPPAALIGAVGEELSRG